MKNNQKEMKNNLNDLIADSHVRTLLEHSIEKRALFISYPKEINVSNFLAWLFNPREGHGLGDKAIKELLTQARNIYDDDIEIDKDSETVKPLGKWGALKIFGTSFSNAIIQRELKVSDKSNDAIDLAIFDRTNKMAIFIEFKFGALQGNNQTKKYCDNILKKLKKSPTFEGYAAIFIFLDQRDEQSKDKRWISLNTEWLVNFLKMQQDSPIIHSSNKKILSDYAELFDDEHQMHRLLSSHRETIDSVVIKHKVILQYFHKKFSQSKYFDHISSHSTDDDLIHTYYQSKEIWDFLAEYAEFTPLIAPLEKEFPEIETEPKKVNIFYHLPIWDDMYVDEYERWGVQIWLKLVGKDEYFLRTSFLINSFQTQYQASIRKLADDLQQGRKKTKIGANRITLEPVDIKGNEQKATSAVIERIKLIKDAINRIHQVNN